MTTVKAFKFKEKPHAGNPHVRFDVGEVASATTPRRGPLRYMDMTYGLKWSAYVGIAFVWANVVCANAVERRTSHDMLNVADSYDAHGCKGVRGDVGWHVESRLRGGLQDESREAFDVWRMRVRSSLASYCCVSGNVQYAVLLTVNPTIFVRCSDVCGVMKLIGARDRAFTFKTGTSGKPSAFFSACRASLPNNGTASVTMCAYGKEPLHEEGDSLEYALLFFGHSALAFAYKMGDDAEVKNVCIPIPDGLSPISPAPDVGCGICSVHDGRHTVSVSVETETTLANQGRFLILTVRSPNAFVSFPISLKNVLSFQECLKARMNGLDCNWRAEVTKNDRSTLLF